MSDTYKYVVRVETTEDTNVAEVQDAVREALGELYNEDFTERVAIADRNGMYDEDTKKVIDIINNIETAHVTNAINFVREQKDG